MDMSLVILFHIKYNNNYITHFLSTYFFQMSCSNCFSVIKKLPNICRLILYVRFRSSWYSIKLIYAREEKWYKCLINLVYNIFWFENWISYRTLQMVNVNIYTETLAEDIYKSWKAVVNRSCVQSKGNTFISVSISNLFDSQYLII